MEKLWYLSQIKIFSNLPKEDLIKINGVTHMSTIPKHTIIQTPDSSHLGLYLVKKGKLRIYKLSSSGKQFTIGIIGHGNTFGETSLFSMETKDTYIETIEDTLLCLFKDDDFEAFLVERPKLLMNILKRMGEKINEQNLMLEQLANYDIKQRLMYWLIKLANEFGNEEGEIITIDLALSHQELANMIGSTRESVTSTLNELVKEEVIITGRMSIGLRKEMLSVFQ
jgi:CRP-like cAMP-binding protein